MTRLLIYGAILAVIGAVAAALVVGFGLFNVSARSGHLPGISWVLHTTFRNSVELRAPPPEAVPDLSSEDLVALGARHYDGACRPCHAGPEEGRTASMRAMLPAPPPIREAVADWEPRHLFWIVKHGIKMSGMPHWPAKDRDDDIWAVVAFLNRVPQMRLPEFEALVAPPDVPETPGQSAASGRDPFAYCASCHGVDGRGRDNAHVPRLDRLSDAYIAASLAAYRSGARQSGIMQHAASTVTAVDDARLARLYAGQTSSPAVESISATDRNLVDPGLLSRGRGLATGEAARGDVPACNACHGPWPERLSPMFPDLAGQPEAYLRRQLELWRDGRRGGTGRAHLMHHAARDLSDAEIAALAAFYAAEPPRPDTRRSDD